MTVWVSVDFASTPSGCRVELTLLLFSVAMCHLLLFSPQPSPNAKPIFVVHALAVASSSSDHPMMSIWRVVNIHTPVAGHRSARTHSRSRRAVNHGERASVVVNRSLNHERFSVSECFFPLSHFAFNPSIPTFLHSQPRVRFGCKTVFPSPFPLGSFGID
jgi:hypothetical protein